MTTKIKICGLRSTHMAEEAVRSGAHYIGIICHPDSKRYVDANRARDIAQAVLGLGGIPVAVFVNHHADEIVDFCQFTGINVVQLHGAHARRAQHLIPVDYQRIYVCSIDDAGISHEDGIHLAACDPRRDYVLFDAKQAGSGQTFAWDLLTYQGPLRIGIAGGITAANVSQVIAQFRPALIDVSSGVDCASGDKDSVLIKAFCRAVQEVDRSS